MSGLWQHADLKEAQRSLERQCGEIRNTLAEITQRLNARSARTVSYPPAAPLPSSAWESVR
jgi:hypothetical protein